MVTEMSIRMMRKFMKLRLWRELWMLLKLMMLMMPRKLTVIFIELHITRELRTLNITVVNVYTGTFCMSSSIHSYSYCNACILRIIFNAACLC